MINQMQALVNNTKSQEKDAHYIRNLLKDFLQVYVLNFIYLHKAYNTNFIFTGGTCLSHCFGMHRLSEDLDFDLKKPIDVEELRTQLIRYFTKDHLVASFQASVLQQGSQLLLKFPLLKQLGLANASDSDLLYVKMDLSTVESSHYEQQATLKSVSHFNYVVIHYDLPSLFAGKINAILTRNRFMGKENTPIIKGRDYYDLLWFLEKKVSINILRLNDLLKSQYSVSEILSLLDSKVEEALTSKKLYFKQDLLPFIDPPQFVEAYIEHYLENYHRYKQYLLDTNP
jgi:predicted nucleotidyltransferase component of viral defense system